MCLAHERRAAHADDPPDVGVTFVTPVKIREPALAYRVGAIWSIVVIVTLMLVEAAWIQHGRPPCRSLRTAGTKRCARMASSSFTVSGAGARSTGSCSRRLWSHRSGNTPLHGVFAEWSTNIRCEPNWIPPGRLGLWR